MDQAMSDMEQQNITQWQQITNAFRYFLTPKPSGAARFIMDLSPWTSYYRTPPIRLYSAAEVLSAIPPTYQLIETDLTSGFFQIKIRQEHTMYYGIYYQGQQFALQRLPMGYPLAPSILQRLAQQVAALLHRKYGVSMVAYLDDWLIFAPQLPAQGIVQTLQDIGLTINRENSHLF
jgi:hypothetical protein